jgi:hypothetical protein
VFLGRLGGTPDGNPVWSPDGVRVSFPVGDSIAIGQLGQATQWLVELPGSVVAWHPWG